MKDGAYMREIENDSGTWWVCLEAGGHWAGQDSAFLLKSKKTNRH